MMKSHYCKVLVSLLIMFCLQSYAEQSTTKFLTHIKMTIDNQLIIIELFDNSASRQLLQQLPLSLNVSDYAGSEKIAYLPKKLTINETPAAKTTQADFTYYAPWGNLAIFYNGYGYAHGVYALGIIKTGKEQLSRIKQTTTATLEYMD